MQSISSFHVHSTTSNLINSVSVHSNISLQTLLYGNLMLSFHANIAIFEAVQKYIHDTNRF